MPDIDNKQVRFVIKKLLPEARKYDVPFKKNREDNRKFYKGDQWRRPQPAYKSKSVSNFTSLIIRDQVAILTDSDPEITVQAADGQKDVATAQVLTKLLKHTMERNSFSELNQKAVKIASIEGISYFRPIWNPLLCDGKGDIEIKVEKADNIRRDPSGEDNFFIIEKEVTLADIYRYYPDAADKVKANLDKDKKVTTTTDKKPIMPVQSTDGSAVATYEKTQVDIEEQYAKVSFCEAWIRDDSTQYVTGKDNDDKDESLPVEESIYPYGRWITIANEEILLEDKPCVTKNFPIVPLILDFDPETEINGISNIDYIKQSQVDYNEMYALTKDWLRAVTYPRFKYDPKSGFDPKKMKNKWGTGIPTMDFQWESPPPLPSDIFKFFVESKSNIEYVSGINDITQGRRPAGIEAAKAIQLLQEASKTMIRPQSRMLENSIKKLGDLCVDYMQYGYTTERMYRIIGEDLVINDPEVKGAVTTIKNDVTVGKYDVYIHPDSTLPVSRIERYGMLMELFDKGAVDRLAIMQETGLHNWQDIEARMKQKEDEQKQQQEEQMAQQQEMGQQQAQAEEQKQQQEMQTEAMKMELEKMKIDNERDMKEKELELKEMELELKKIEVELKHAEAETNANRPIENKDNG